MTPEGSAGLTPFGRQLRYWRSVRGMSQLDLAVAAGTTPRHVSFVETGRSRPGSDLVTRLADVLAVPLRERNDLLAAAGLAPAYPHEELDGQALVGVRALLERVLAAHEPYPAWVVGRGLRVLAANDAAEVVFPGLTAMAPADVVDFWFTPGPQRDRVVNWSEVARSALSSLRREAVLGGVEDLGPLLARAERLSRDLPGGSRTDEPPVACPVLRVGETEIRTIALAMRFDAAVEVTTSELRIELMYPADEKSDRALRRLTQGPSE